MSGRQRRKEGGDRSINRDIHKRDGGGGRSCKKRRKRGGRRQRQALLSRNVAEIEKMTEKNGMISVR